MALPIPRPIQLPGGVDLAPIGDPVGAGKIRRVDLRACNIHGSNGGTASVYLEDTLVPANSGFRSRTYPIPNRQPGSAPDLEYGLLLTEGFQLQVAASAPDTVAFSMLYVDSALTDFAGVQRPIQQVGTTALAGIGPRVPAGEVHQVNLRACNIHASNGGFGSIWVDDGLDAGNSGWRSRNFPAPFRQSGSAPDLEFGFWLTEGQQLQVSASAAATVAFSYTNVVRAN